MVHSCPHVGLQGCVVKMAAKEPAEQTALVTLSVRVPVELRRRLRVYAAGGGVSAQDCVQSALSLWLDQRESEGDQR